MQVLMRNRALGRIGAATLLAAGAIALAAPAEAQTTWTMPDVKGWILQRAHDEIVKTSDGAVVPVTSDADGTPYQQLNLSDWVVCSQSPAAGGEFSVQRPPRLKVARPNACK